jgi:transposase
VRSARLWARLVGVQNEAVVEGVREDIGTGSLIVSVRPTKGNRSRCGRCGRRSPGYDQGEGPRLWRSLDAGTIVVFIEAQAPRVTCRDHGVTVSQVPWARHDTGHTRAFDDQIAWLAVHTSKTAVCSLMRIAWRTVGAVISRVVADARTKSDPFDGLTRIGIDEVSYKRGHKYLTVVVDHDTGRLVWAAPGRDKATLRKFFDLLGPVRAQQIVLVSADAADWIATVIHERCLNATLCADPFHMIAWATTALDEIRRQHWRDARLHAPKGTVQQIKGCRYALLKNPENLTEYQQVALASVQKLNKTMYRAYLLKEQFRLVFKLRGPEAFRALNDWLKWAQRCRIKPFVNLAKRIKKHRTSIEATLTHGLSNALTESTNTKIRLLMRIAYGFRSTDNLIALCYLDRGGHCPPLPNRK